MSIGFELWKHSCSARRGQSCGSTEISLRAPWDQSQSPISCRPDAGRRASRTQSTASRAARLSWRNAIRSRSGGDHQSIPGGSHALANPIAFPDRCSAARHNPGGLGAIADQLSMVCQVLRQLDVRYDLLLLHELSTVYDDVVRHWGGLHPKSLFPPGTVRAPAQPSARVTTRLLSARENNATRHTNSLSATRPIAAGWRTACAY